MVSSSNACSSWLISAPASDFVAVVKPSGFPILLSEEDNLTDLQFAALARNAFAGDPEALAWWEANRVKPENVEKVA